MTQALVKLIIALVFTLFFSLGLLDWAGGCGESFTYADGSVHSGECIGRDLVKSTFRRLLK